MGTILSIIGSIGYYSISSAQFSRDLGRVLIQQSYFISLLYITKLNLTGMSKLNSILIENKVIR